jgi:hypothetical protein
VNNNRKINFWEVKSQKEKRLLTKGNRRKKRGERKKKKNVLQ